MRNHNYTRASPMHTIPKVARAEPVRDLRESFSSEVSQLLENLQRMADRHSERLGLGLRERLGELLHG